MRIQVIGHCREIRSVGLAAHVSAALDGTRRLTLQRVGPLS